MEKKCMQSKKIPKKLYRFRSLETPRDFFRVVDIIKKGFYCSSFFEFNDMNEGVYWGDPATDDLFDQKKRYKICSFSQECALHSPLMWGHYANAGMGIAIEVKFDASLDEYFNAVQYYCGEMPATPKGQSRVEKILSRKSSAWAYEHEWRFISNTFPKDDERLEGEITKIYFGAPYKHLGNYDKNLQNNNRLKSFLCYSKILQCLCDSKGIPYKEYGFGCKRDVFDEKLLEKIKAYHCSNRGMEHRSKEMLAEEIKDALKKECESNCPKDMWEVNFDTNVEIKSMIEDLCSAIKDTNTIEERKYKNIEDVVARLVSALEIERKR